MTKDKLVVTSWDRTKVISIAKITIFAIEITLVQIYTLIHRVKKISKNRNKGANRKW